MSTEDQALGPKNPDSATTDGLVIIYTGQGKGKTTAALGLVFRALGYGMKVGVVQFIKGKWQTGERLFAATLPQLDFDVMGRGFTWDSDDLSRDREAARAAWSKARGYIVGGAHRIVVLDEVSYALNYGFVDAGELIQALAERPRQVSVVLTGRAMPDAIMAVADLITEMSLVRHPFSQGRKAVRGVDY